MARARNIKPGIRTNDELAELNPLTRLTFIYLWMSADFNGNMLYKPKRLKAENLPYDDVDIEAIISELERSGFVKIYDENGSRYLSIKNFKKHQNPHKNEVMRGTDIPTPEEVAKPVYVEGKSKATQSFTGDHDKDGNDTEQGRDENGSRRPDSGFLIPDSGYQSESSSSADDSLEELEALPLQDGTEYIAKDDFVAEMARLYPQANLAKEFKGMRAWLIANPAKKKTRRGMTKFINGWLSKAKPTAQIHRFERSNQPPRKRKMFPGIDHAPTGTGGDA